MRRLRIPHSISMTGSTMLALTTTATLLLSGAASAQSRHYPLESLKDLRLHNVTAERATLQGKESSRVTMSAETLRRLQGMTPGEQLQVQQLAAIEGLEFANGIIEAELAGAPAPGAPEGARGFVGIAFRLQNDMKTYEAFYLRPTNGRADDQERRNHAAQYISQPDWTWSRLRKETPSRYEAYVDLTPAVGTK